MKLVLCGGVQGVGKTTLLTLLENEFPGRIATLDPGELFRRYFYENRSKTIEEIEDLVVDTLKEMPDDVVAIVHWHYAVRRPEGYVPQIALSRLARLAKSGKIGQVVLLRVEAPADVVLKRRAKDQEPKKRALSRPIILEEMAADEQFLARHQTLFSEALGSRNVTVFRLLNTELDAARNLLGDFFKSLIE